MKNNLIVMALLLTIACTEAWGQAEDVPVQLEVGVLPETSNITREFSIKLGGGNLGILKSIEKSCGCVSSIQAPIGEDFKDGKPIPVKLIFNTIGKPAIFRTNLAFTFEDGYRQKIYVAKLEGRVMQKFTIAPDQLDLGVVQMGALSVKKIPINNISRLPLILSKADDRLECKLTNDNLEVSPSTKEMGLFNAGIDINQGDLEKHFIITWEVRNPICDKVALIQGLVACNVVHSCDITLRSDRAFKVERLVTTSVKLKTEYSATWSQEEHAIKVTIKYRYPEKASLDDEVILYTSLLPPNNLISIPFSAIFY